MTLQETFDKVVNGLRKQGCRSLKNGRCRYRGDNGRKCAVGMVIPDEDYNPDMECAVSSAGSVYRYDPKAHRCLSNCDSAAPFHTHDLMEGAELSISRHFQVGPIEPFVRVGGAAVYHRLTAQFGGITLLGQDGKAFNGWIPTILAGGGICYSWVCGETTYYYGLGGPTDWSAGLPISKQSVQTLLTVNVPIKW